MNKGFARSDAPRVLERRSEALAMLYAGLELSCNRLDIHLLDAEGPDNRDWRDTAGRRRLTSTDHELELRPTESTPGCWPSSHSAICGSASTSSRSRVSQHHGWSGPSSPRRPTGDGAQPGAGHRRRVGETLRPCGRLGDVTEQLRRLDVDVRQPPVDATREPPGLAVE